MTQMAAIVESEIETSRSMRRTRTAAAALVLAVVLNYAKRKYPVTRLNPLPVLLGASAISSFAFLLRSLLK